MDQFQSAPSVAQFEGMLQFEGIQSIIAAENRFKIIHQ
jgi:hypothetical protein